MRAGGVFMYLAIGLIGTARQLISDHEAVRDGKYIVAGLLSSFWLYRHEIASIQWALSERAWTTGYGLPLMIAAVVAIALYSIFKSSHPALPHQQRLYILPCQTTHTRIFPEKHTFSYSYLQVAIPVGWQGSIGRMISVDQASDRRWTLFAIHASDYLARGDEHLGLKKKLDVYLRSQMIDSSRFTSAWLVTAPRFLGYSFNPVSFWYLYQENSLAGMILEVNNTFDERRMYYLPQQSAPPNMDRFRHQWAKDFHVSPFNSRKGAYSLVATPPSFARGRGIDNVITLQSSKAHAKLVARLVSTSPPLEIVRLGRLARLQLVLSWSWVGFATFPRILYEAARLFFQRRLHVWYRPEVAATSIGRTATERELLVADCFQSFLQHCAASKRRIADKPISTQSISLTYITTSGQQSPLELSFPGTADPSVPIELRVLSPQFYTDIATASSLATCIRRLAALPPEQQTARVSAPSLLLDIFNDPANPPVVSSPSFRLLSLLRRILSPRVVSGLIPRQKHELDAFMMACMPSRAGCYRRAVTALILGQGLHGLIGILFDAVLVALRAGVVVWCVHVLVHNTVTVVCETVTRSERTLGAAYLGVIVGACWYNRQDGKGR